MMSERCAIARDGRRGGMRMIVLFGAILLMAGFAHASDAAEYPLLRESDNVCLQRNVESELRVMKSGGLVRKAIDENRLSIAVADITNPEKPRVAEINGDVMMYAASLPKIAILLAAFEKISDGRMAPSKDNLRLMMEMIRRSSNVAATELMERVGFSYVNSVLASDRYRLYDASHNGGLWVGKAYGPGPAFNRDPLHGLSHGATAMQVARFYYLLSTGRLVSERHSEYMKIILSNPGINHKFVKGIGEIDPDAKLYRKSGTWREWHSDSAIIERAGKTYIAVAMVHDKNGGHIVSEIIKNLDAAVFGSCSELSLASR